MKIRAIFRFGLLFAALLVLSGCVAGQSIRMAYEPVSQPAMALNVAVTVQVEDKRPFVLSGDKTPSYIGHYRAGFGNTWDVNTANKEPLAGMIQRDLGADLQALGFNLVAPAGAVRTVAVSIEDWNFDTYLNGKFWYSCRVRVLDGSGQQRYEQQLKDTIVIEGSFWVGAKYAFEREMPKIYQSIIGKMVREAPAALAALKE